MRESSNLEYKRELSRSYLKTVSAYANYETGRIIFGVDDNGEMVGIDDPAGTALSIENAINDSIDPVPDYSIDIDEVSRTVTLIVRDSPDKPYLYKGKAYRRADSSTVEVGRAEARRLAVAGLGTTFDALVSTQQDLTFDRLGRGLAEKIGLQELDRNALVSLEIMSADGRYNNAAALLADANRFPGIDVARFGSSISVILSRHTFAGISVLAQMDSLMALFDEHYVYEKIVGMDRVTRESVPREAFREALANALVHRTWDVEAHVKVSMFQDRIEVSSPGGLPQGITEDEYLAGGLAVARNPILANVFFRLGYIERFGTGIPRILQEYAECDVSPSFIVRGASIAVTLPVVDGVSFDDDERAVLGAVPKGSSRTRSQIAQDTGMSKDKSIRVINRLVDRRMLAREGAGRSVRYSRM